MGISTETGSIFQKDANAIKNFMKGIRQAREAIVVNIRNEEIRLASRGIKEPDEIYNQTDRDDVTAGNDRALFRLVQAEVKNKSSAQYHADKIIEKCLYVPGGAAIIAMVAALSNADSDKSIIDWINRINLKVETSDEERHITLKLPPQSCLESRQAPNSHPENEIAPGNSTEWSCTIYFNSGDRTHDEQAAFLKNKGEKFANPFWLELAEAASLLKNGASLFEFKGNPYMVRTARVRTKIGDPEHRGYLIAYVYSVFVGYGCHSCRNPDVVAVGSPGTPLAEEK